MSKFNTTNSELFTKNNINQIPEWMQTFADNIEYKDKSKLDIQFDKKGAFELATQVNRPEANATPREMIAGLNNDKLILDSKIELSKFLKGRYYKTDANVQGNKVFLNTKIDGIQAEFIFPYKFVEGKTINDSTFLINDCEYPFSYAGFTESLDDLKKGTLKKSNVKVASTRNSFVINREEIIRRFNGHLREATNAIEKNLKDGTIIGAGSNSYATYYDPDILFPQIEKEKPEDPNGSFEFVNNSEHVATNEYKSAKKLSLEANKLIGHLFSNYIVNNTTRDKDELLLDTQIFNQKTGMRHKVNFNFKIQNEKLAKLQFAEINNERLSIEQLLDKLNLNNNLVNQYLKTSTASKYIPSGMIFTERELKNKLANIVENKNIVNIINAWSNTGLISPINSTTYSSKLTFEELLNNIECKSLTTAEIEKINNYKKLFGSNMDFDRINQKDTGVRESDDIDLSQELKLSKVNNLLSKKFKHYQIISANNDNIQIQFSNNGIRHNINLISKFNGQKLEKINAIVNGKTISIDNLESAFKTSNILKSYLQDNKANNFSSNIVASEKNILNRLANIVKNPNEVFSQWKNKYLQEIGNGIYTCNKSFEELLNLTSDNNILSEKDKHEILIAKQFFGKSLERIVQKDTGIRDIDDTELSQELKLSKVNSLLSKSFKNYKVISAGINNMQIPFSNNGIRHNVKIAFKFNDRKLEKISAIVNGKAIDIDSLQTMFKTSSALKSYLQDNKVNNFSSNIILSEKTIINRLSNIVKNPNEVFSQWKNNLLQEIGNGIYTCDNTFEELLDNIDSNLLTIAEIEKINNYKKTFGSNMDFDRINQKDTGIRDLESRINDETLLYEANNYLSKQFENYSINNFIQKNNDVCLSSINIFDNSLGLSTDVDFVFGFLNGKVKKCKAIINGQTVDINNVKKAFAMNEALSKYLKINSGKKFNVPMVITKHDLMRKLSSITNASSNEIDDIINLWQQHGKIYQLDNKTYASKLSLEQLISMSNIKPLSDDEIIEKLNKCRRDKGMSLVSNYIKDSDTRRPEEKWSLEKMVLHARAAINSMFADFDIIDAELNNNNYVITARIINPINGLKQSLKFNFITSNGTKLGEINSISDGIKTVTSDRLITLLESNNKAVNKFIKLNSVADKQYKNIISKNNLKEKLLTMIDMNNYNDVIDKLVTASIINPIDNFNYATEYSFPELIQYLSNTNSLNLKVAEQKLKLYNKDNIVNTNVKHIKETDTRLLEKKEEKLSPDLIRTSEKIKQAIKIANSQKKITNNKHDSLLESLNNAKNGYDIENVWRELKRYLQ